MDTTLYNNTGRAVAYVEDNQHIFLFNGTVAGHIDGNSIFSYSGKHLGWYENGWVRDNSGNCVFFTEDVTGSGPVKPVKSIKPVKSVKQIKPVKGVKQIRPIKAVAVLGWSNLSGEQFFQQ